MNAIDCFNGSELSLTAYALLHAGITGEEYLDALQDKEVGMTVTQAQDFATHYTVVDQYTDSSSGFSATVFQDAQGKRYVAIRGTQLSDVMDLIEDSALAISGTAGRQIIALYNYVQRLKGAKNESVSQMEWNELSSSYVLNPTGATGLLDTPLSGEIDIVGHSLGGHLAIAFGRLFPGNVTQIYTYNAPGFHDALSRDFWGEMEQLTGVTVSSFQDGKVTNLFGSELNIIAGYADDHGTPQEVCLENNTHSIVDLTDSLAVYSLFAGITPSLTMEDISGIIRADAHQPDMALETTVQKLADVLLSNAPEISGGDREALYRGIQSMQGFVGGNITIASLAGLSESALASLAEVQNESGLAARYALVNLNPFTVSGQAGLYSRFNTNGELEIHSKSNPDGDLSMQYIEDRAKFLYYLTHPEAVVSNFDPDVDFVDNRLGISLEVDNGMIGADDDSQYLFGNLEGELLEGGSAGDHLYGMDGADALIGNGNNDYIEGGKGQDTLSGGSGNDTFFIFGEDTAYDDFIGGSGADEIMGSAGNDIIRVNLFNATTSIERINGGGGSDIIAGTKDNDTIDLSKTTLTGIARIEGGGGSDIVKGSNAGDILYGAAMGSGDDASEDRLEGGAGNDEYHIGQSDIIKDSDGQGTIWFGNTKLSGLTLARQGKNGLYTQDSGEVSASYDPVSKTLQVFDLSDSEPLSFTVENFSSGNLGITLKEEQPENLDRILTGTANHDEMGILDFGSDSKNWQLTYTAFPAGATSNTPFYKEDLSAVAPRMQITGGAGGDFLFGFVRHDEILGGDSGDIIIGDMSSYNGKSITMAGILEGDLLDGGAGNDWLQGSGEIDQLIGGEGIDLLQGFNGNDILSGDKDNDVLAGGSHADILIGGDGDDILLGEGYFSGTGTLTLDNLSTFGVDFTISAADYYTGYISRNFTIHNDAPNGGNDVLLGGQVGIGWMVEQVMTSWMVGSAATPCLAVRTTTNSPVVMGMTGWSVITAI
jgi:Ca2+-binding RTX toxin-like protein